MTALILPTLKSSTNALPPITLSPVQSALLQDAAAEANAAVSR